MILRVAKNIDEYITILNQIKSEMTNYWFRGQSNSNYMLEPSLYRDKKLIVEMNRTDPSLLANKGKYILQDDITALHKFKDSFSKIYDCSNFQFVDYLYIMQHYGIPTRLLDFTKDELVALYFAVSKNNTNIHVTDDEINEFYASESFTDMGSAVFCIDPIITNDQSFLTKSILDLNEYKFESLGNIDTPVCIETMNPDKRIVAQKSVFVFFGYNVNPYDYYSVFNKITYKIFIPNSCRKKILIDLKKRFAISHSTMFPDIEGIAMEIKEEIKEKFINDCAKWD